VRTTWNRAWATSAVAALAVAAVLLAVWWLARPSSERDGAHSGAGVVAPVGRDPVLAHGAVRVDSYTVRGDRLLLNYTSGVPECYGVVALGPVEQRADAVTVGLRTVRPPDPPELCRDLAVTGTLTVDLQARLGRRWVVDGSFAPIVRVARVAEPYVTPGQGDNRLR
jgi:hypothetical protein